MTLYSFIEEVYKLETAHYKKFSGVHEFPKVKPWPYSFFIAAILESLDDPNSHNNTVGGCAKLGQTVQYTKRNGYLYVYT